MLEKVIRFAEEGNGRRLLNTLKKRNSVLTSSELDTVLKAYSEMGLPREVEALKKRRGILSSDQYDILAKKVRDNCCAEKFDLFAVSLKNLLSCGITMNPTKMEDYS